MRTPMITMLPVSVVWHGRWSAILIQEKGKKNLLFLGWGVLLFQLPPSFLFFFGEQPVAFIYMIKRLFEQ